MKFSPKTGLKILLTGSLLGCTSAIFAAPRGKGYVGEYIDHGSEVRQTFSKKRKIVKGGYLSAHVLPQLEITGTEAAMEGHGNVSNSGTKPTFKSFLAYMELHREAKEAEENPVEDKSVPGVDSVSAVDKELAPAAPGGTVPAEPATDGQAADPITAGEVTISARPIFPRPPNHGMDEDKFLMYFPVGGFPGAEINLVTPGSFESIFLPPGSSDMRSNATFTLEP